MDFLPAFIATSTGFRSTAVGKIDRLQTDRPSLLQTQGNQSVATGCVRHIQLYAGTLTFDLPALSLPPGVGDPMNSPKTGIETRKRLPHGHKYTCLRPAPLQWSWAMDWFGLRVAETGIVYWAYSWFYAKIKLDSSKYSIFSSKCSFPVFYPNYYLYIFASQFKSWAKHLPLTLGWFFSSFLQLQTERSKDALCPNDLSAFKPQAGTGKWQAVCDQPIYQRQGTP